MTIALRRQHGFSWLALVSAFAVHVFDEAASGFLPLYNEIATTVRESSWFVSLPVFSYPVWLGALIAGIAVLFLLSPLVFKGRRPMQYLSYLLSAVMTVNALGHIGASVYLGYLVPGVLSSPLLLVAAIALFVTAIRASRSAAT